MMTYFFWPDKLKGRGKIENEADLGVVGRRGVGGGDARSF